MGEYLNELQKGRGSARLKSTPQAIMRGAYHALVITFVVLAPVWVWWERLIVALIFMLIWGMIASSTRLGRFM